MSTSGFRFWGTGTVSDPKNDAEPVTREAVKRPPLHGGAWWAAVYGVAPSRTWLKRLSRPAGQPTWSSHGISMKGVGRYAISYPHVFHQSLPCWFRSLKQTTNEVDLMGHIWSPGMSMAVLLVQPLGRLLLNLSTFPEFRRQSHWRNGSRRSENSSLITTHGVRC